MEFVGQRQSDKSEVNFMCEYIDGDMTMKGKSEEFQRQKRVESRRTSRTKNLKKLLCLVQCLTPRLMCGARSY